MHHCFACAAKSLSETPGFVYENVDVDERPDLPYIPAGQIESAEDRYDQSSYDSQSQHLPKSFAFIGEGMYRQ
jgi:hypothetical protein